MQLYADSLRTVRYLGTFSVVLVLTRPHMRACAHAPAHSIFLDNICQKQKTKNKREQMNAVIPGKALECSTLIWQRRIIQYQISLANAQRLRLKQNNINASNPSLISFLSRLTSYLWSNFSQQWRNTHGECVVLLNEFSTMWH